MPDKNTFIIPFFIPRQGCRHRCAFCDQYAVTGNRDRFSVKRFHQVIGQWLGFKRKKNVSAQIAFYGGNFLGLDKKTLEEILRVTQPYVQKGDIVGIRFSTRPDTITGQNMELIKKYPVIAIEIGVQSLNDGILNKCRRGHSAADSMEAIRRVKKNGIPAGVQLMTGLPGDSGSDSIQNVRRLLPLKPDMARIYPTLVLKNTRLAAWWKEGSFRPLDIRTSVDIVKEMYLLFKKNHIPVIRMGLQSSAELDNPDTVLAGPYHPAFGHLVHSKIFYDLAVDELEKKNRLPDTLCLTVHPKSISKMRGLKNQNIKMLKEKYDLVKIRIRTDDKMPVDEIQVGDK